MKSLSGTLAAPFPYFGGKSLACETVWCAFGAVDNYVEPFAGSVAMLLGAPDGKRVETINDADGYVANFWRAVQHAPDEVVRYADWPVNETDLFARHLWLVNTGRERIAAMEADPDHFDAQVAGWWVWGLCAWIGSGWCSGRGPWQLPHLGNPGRGVNRQLPHLGDPGRGYQKQTDALLEWIRSLSVRLRKVRVCCGDWSRVVTPSVLRGGGFPCGVFLDPPYDEGNENYSVAVKGIAAEVREWALANGEDKKLRIVLAGYEGEHEMPETWKVYAYSATGAYIANGTKASENRHRERLWFSPHCLSVNAARSLFDEESDEATA